MSNTKSYLKERGIFAEDGTNFRPDSDQFELIVKNDEIQEFLHEKLHSPKRIIIGPKGAGKSMLLCTKSWKTRKSDAYNIPISNQLTYIFSLKADIKKITQDTYTREDTYEIIWKFSLRYFILIRLIVSHDLELPSIGRDTESLPGSEMFRSMLSQDELLPIDLGLIVSLLLSNKGNISELDTLRGKLDNILSYLRLKLAKPICVYIDNVDQEFLDNLRITNYPEIKISKSTSHKKKSNNNIATWLNVNIAFLKAIWDINKDGNSILVYASVRYEAWFHLLQTQNHFNIPQLRSTCLFLEYKDEELKELINNFISIQDGDLKSNFEELLHTKRPHPKTTSRSINKETFVNLLIRHTFGNPRELIVLLPFIKKQLEIDIENKEEIEIEKYAVLVDEITNNKIFEESFMQECMPQFPKKRLLNFLKRHPNNFFTKTDIFSQKNFSTSDWELVIKLYRYGLVGSVEKNKNGFIQKFRLGLNYPEENIELPKSKIYLVHPCLDFYLSKINPKKFYYHHCIIGNGLDFVFKARLQYYTPQTFSSRCKEIESIYKKFYDSVFAIDAFNDIPKELDSRYWTLILNDCHSKSTSLATRIKTKINGDLVKCGNKNQASLIHLKRNIKLRVVLTIASLLKVFEEGSEVIKLFGSLDHLNPTMDNLYSITFTQGCFTPSRDINLKKLVNSLSSFETDIILEFLQGQTLRNYVETIKNLETQSTIRRNVESALALIQIPLKELDED